eukprot:5850872-Amphidinium_carterae.1
MGSWSGCSHIITCIFALHVLACYGAKYLIGQEANSGAFEVDFSEEKHELDLRSDCHDSKPCPPVIVMKGRMDLIGYCVFSVRFGLAEEERNSIEPESKSCSN